MQVRAGNSNKKQKKDVQILSEIKRIKTLHNTKSTRAKFVCNPKLEELIELANVLPANFNFDFEKNVKERGIESTLSEWKNILLKELPGEAREYIKDKTSLYVGILNRTFVCAYPEKFKGIKTIEDVDKFLVESHQFYKSQDQFELSKDLDDESFNFLLAELSFHNNQDEPADFWLTSLNPLIESVKAKDFLNGVVELNKPFLKDVKKTSDIDSRTMSLFFASIPSKLSSFQNIFSPELSKIRNILTETKVSLSNDGVITFELSDYAKALQGVNISRLRTCEDCNKFFWAKRKDAYTCSFKHSRNRRMRLLRESWKKSGRQYLNARKKKAEKKKENKKNGNL